VALRGQLDRFHYEQWESRDQSWNIRHLRLGTQPTLDRPADDSRVFALLHGDLHNEADLRRELIAAGLPAAEGAGSVLAKLYQCVGAENVASRLHGAFCAAVLDARRKQLLLINDRIGSYPIYWHDGSQQFVFGPSVDAVLRKAGSEVKLEPRAVADYLTFGFLLGDKTLDAQVRLLPPASVLTYHWDTESRELQRYWSASSLFQPGQLDHSSYLTAVRDSFNESVQRSLEGDRQFGVALSGGLDSRAIMSAIDCKQTPVSTYTLGVAGCADEVIAQRLAKISGTQHRFFALEDRYLGEFVDELRHMVRLTDGMYLTHGVTEMLALRFLQETEITMLLRGHAAELAKASLAWPLHTDEAIYRMQSKEEFIPYFLRRVNYISGNISWQELFSEAWFEQVDGQAKRSLESSLADVDLAPPDLCSYLYLNEHHRRFTVASLEVFRTQCDVRMPFADEQFLSVLLQGRSQWRDNTEIHQTIIGKNQPRLLRVRNSNTGAPGDAGPLLTAVLDKFNTLGRRLNVYGYRHYHNFHGWMQQRLIKAVEETLLSPHSLSRGIYRESGLRRLVADTTHGHADHSYLLQVLLILELWQQQYD
jgi:asparagine synthase (glutamine-hydrolysing)